MVSVIKINRKVEYALMALKYMADKTEGELTSAREVCENFQTPFDTTAKVMQAMNIHNILTSIKGVKGGYTLARKLSEISYMELSRIVEGKEVEMSCRRGGNVHCELAGNCNIITPVERLNHKLNDYLEKLSLQELLLENMKEIPNINQTGGQ